MDVLTIIHDFSATRHGPREIEYHREWFSFYPLLTVSRGPLR